MVKLTFTPLIGVPLSSVTVALKELPSKYSIVRLLVIIFNPFPLEEPFVDKFLELEDL